MHISAKESGKPGHVVSCTKCGLYAEHYPRKLLEPCPGLRDTDKAKRIRQGRHPKKAERLVDHRRWCPAMVPPPYMTRAGNLIPEVAAEEKVTQLTLNNGPGSSTDHLRSEEQSGTGHHSGTNQRGHTHHGDIMTEGDPPKDEHDTHAQVRRSAISDPAVLSQQSCGHSMVHPSQVHDEKRQQACNQSHEPDGVHDNFAQVAPGGHGGVDGYEDQWLGSAILDDSEEWSDPLGLGFTID